MSGKATKIGGLAASLLLTLIAASSCGTLKPLTPGSATVDPSPLELRGGKVPAVISLNIPQKWFNRNAVVRITPVLKHPGGQQWGSAYTFQGEKVRGNARTIPYDEAVSLTLNSDFDWSREYRKSDLFLMFNATVGGKKIELPDLKIGEGVIAAEDLADARYVTPAIAPDDFRRVIREKFDADIHFLIQQADLRASELRSGDLKAWKEVIENADYAPNQNVDIEIQAYASPDGGLELNEKLAARREKNTGDYLRKELARMNVDAPIAAYYTAQDWEGFQELVQASDLPDKELVLRVLSMYKDPERREQEIKNISSVYSELADLILPKLRRSRLIANIETIGKSDAEILELAASAPARLSLEELLYAATLTDDPLAREAAYKEAAKRFPKDYRAYNNLAAIAFERNDIGPAEELLRKAAQLAGDAGVPNPDALLVNQALLQLMGGNTDQAKVLLGQVSDSDLTAEAFGLLHIREGRYTEAAGELYHTFTNNAILAQILAKDYARALEIADLMGENMIEKDGTTFYLLALAGHRMGDKELVLGSLASALSLDPSLSELLKTDRELSRYSSDPLLDSFLAR